MPPKHSSSSRYFCQLCKVFVPENPAAKRHHESSSNHQRNVQFQVKDAVRLQKKADRDAAVAEAELRRIENEANRAADADRQIFGLKRLHPLSSAPVSRGQRGSNMPSSFSPSKAANPEVEEHGWFAHRSEEGKLSFMNEKTGESSLIPPPEFGKVSIIPPPATSENKSESIRPPPPRPVTSLPPPKPVTSIPPPKPGAVATASRTDIDPQTGFGIWREEEPTAKRHKPEIASAPAPPTASIAPASALTRATVAPAAQGQAPVPASGPASVPVPAAAASASTGSVLNGTASASFFHKPVSFSIKKAAVRNSNVAAAWIDDDGEEDH